MEYLPYQLVQDFFHQQYIWSNYSNLTRPGPPRGSWGREMGPLISGKSRLVKIQQSYNPIHLYSSKKTFCFFLIKIFFGDKIIIFNLHSKTKKNNRNKKHPLKKMGGGFKHVLFSPRKLGKIPILTSIFGSFWFNHQLDIHYIFVPKLISPKFCHLRVAH